MGNTDPNPRNASLSQNANPHGLKDVWHIVPTPNARLKQSHEADHPLLSRHHLHWSNIDMDIRAQFFRPKKEVKHQLTGSKPEPNKTVGDVDGSSEPRVLVDNDDDQEGNRVSTCRSQDRSAIRLPRLDEPEPVSARESANDQERI